MKFKVRYIEIYEGVYIVEAKSKAEAREKVAHVADEVEDLLDCYDMLDEKIEVEGEATEKDIQMYEKLPEEEEGEW